MNIFAVSTLSTPHFTCMPCISRDGLYFTLFLYTMRDEAMTWAKFIEHREVTTWQNLIKKFIKKLLRMLDEDSS